MVSGFSPVEKDKNKNKNPTDVGNLNSASKPGNAQPVATTAAARASGGSPAGKVGHETPIDPFDKVYRGMPPTITASLPYFQRNTVTGNTSNKYLEYDLDFRLNSIFDCVRDSDDIDINTDGTQVSKIFKPKSDTGSVKPMWRDMYANVYQYYAVLGCRWRLTCENLSTRPLYLYTIYRNSQYPPQAVDRKYMQFWPHTKTYRIAGFGKVVTTDGTLDPDNAAGAAPSLAGATEGIVNVRANDTIVIGDTWKPGMVNREIRDDSEAKTWIQIGANPALEENLVFRWVPEDNNAHRTGATFSSASDVNAHFKFRYELQIDYLVQFKDQVIQVKYQVTDNPITATVASYTVL